MRLIRLLAPLLAAAPLVLGLPAFAKDPQDDREVMDCGVMRACTVGEPCRDDDGTLVELVFLSWTEAQITFGGNGPHPLTLDPELRTGAWRMGDVTMQFISTGDGGVVLTSVPFDTHAQPAQVLFLHCSPQ